MTYVVYSNYGHIQGIINNEHGAWIECSIQTTGVGQDPIARYNTYDEAKAATCNHYNRIAKVQFAGLLRDTIGSLD